MNSFVIRLTIIGVVLAGFAVFMCCMGVISFIGDQRFNANAEPFQSVMDQYTNVSGLQDGLEGNPTGYRRGKVLLIDMGENNVSRWHDFSDSVFAATPEEVETVIQLNFDYEYEGEYSNGVTAQRQTLDATVIDYKERKVVGHLSASAPPTPNEIEYSSEATTKVDEDQFINMVKALPERN